MEKIEDLEYLNLNNAQKDMLIKWYEENVDSMDEFSFECEVDFEEDFLLRLHEKNYFNTINSAINDFIVNVLAKGI